MREERRKVGVWGGGGASKAAPLGFCLQTSRFIPGCEHQRGFSQIIFGAWNFFFFFRVCVLWSRSQMGRCFHECFTSISASAINTVRNETFMRLRACATTALAAFLFFFPSRVSSPLPLLKRFECCFSHFFLPIDLHCIVRRPSNVETSGENHYLTTCSCARLVSTRHTPCVLGGLLCNVIGCKYKLPYWKCKSRASLSIY